MKFCPKCGAIILPKNEDGKTIFRCRCGYSEEGENVEMKEKVVEKDKIEVADEDQHEMSTVKEECPKCGHEEAIFWIRQTRAGDEGETKFFRCTKCKHTWRDYN